MKSIRWKLVIMYIALLFIVMVISGTYMIFTLRGREEENSYSELRRYAVMIRDNVIEPIYPKGENAFSGINASTFQSSLYSFSGGENALLQGYIIKYSTQNRRTIATTVTNDTSEFLQIDTSVVIAAAAGGEGFGYNRKLGDTAGGALRPFYEFAMPYITDDESGFLIIYVRKDAKLSNDNLNQITNTYAISVMIALMLAAVLSVLFASSLTVPISNLTHNAKELAKGNLSRRISVQTKDEIGQLSESFNHMAAALSHMMRNIEQEKSKMVILMNNMTDGVLAYDDNGKLIHANYVCGELLGINPLEDIPLDDILSLLKIDLTDSLEKSEKLIDVLTAVFAVTTDSTITIGDKYINALFNVYKNNDGQAGGIVIVLQDITKHMKLDNMRKEFVANVSHEIRTPLTTIKAYTETLMDGGIDDPEISTDFLQMIDNETDRMTSIVTDLLELSRFDNNQLDLELAESDLSELVQKTVKQNIVTAEKNGKKIIFEPPARPMPVIMDARRVNQVFNNIIINALKYSNVGAVVKIDIDETESSYRVYIKDNGLGIPKEDLRRIFERFYRVDKARSREMGGTGLGLSIAKEIMEAHGGKISCVSELGKGTTMILRFPKGSNSVTNETDNIRDINL